MKLSLLATLTLAATAIAQGGGDGGNNKQLQPGATCKKDGSMGVCQGGFCFQEKDADQGKCKQKN